MFSSQAALRDLHSYINVPSLPPRLLLCMMSYQKQCEVITHFLQEVLSTREYLSNKVLHLFLQTNLTLEKIKLNIDGLRDDDVPQFPLEDKRDNSRNGFSEIFGDDVME